MLEVERVSVRYARKDRYALKEVSLNCDLTGITALVGRSGVGKTTLIAMVAGIYGRGDPAIDKYSGNILVNGQCPSTMRGPRKVSWVPQVPVLLEHLTVIENVLLPLTLDGKARVDADAEKADKLLTDLGLYANRKSRPKELSGGMRAIVSLARALVSKPEYLFLDEPFVGLDLMSRWKIYRLLCEERRCKGLVTVMTTHNIPEAVILSDRIIVVVKTDAGLTLASVSENKAELSVNVDPCVCLAAARATAKQIEEKVFFGEFSGQQLS
jgi:NitT/TauT family transport system ATP-binding protein